MIAKDAIKNKDVKKEAKVVDTKAVKEEVIKATKTVKEEVVKTTKDVDLTTKTVAELRELAKDIKGYSTMKKAELIEALKK
ncbi:MAG: Rho termination factor N-terminal domain-containing protein [Bacilli bacterium]